MNKKIIIINGSGGVGKDTFVECCSKFARVKNISSVDKVKEAAKILVGWAGQKDEKSRKLLVDLKQLSINFNDAPTKYIQEEANKFKDDVTKDIMFVHIREIQEIQKIKKLLDAKTLLITSSRVNKILTNSSDAKVEEYHYDYHISNDETIEVLTQKAEKFINDIVKC